jgi:hypothetical protein
MILQTIQGSVAALRHGGNQELGTVGLVYFEPFQRLLPFASAA